MIFLARKTNHGQSVRRANFTLSEANWLWLHTDTSITNQSELVNHLLDAAREIKGFNTSRETLEYELAQIETQEHTLQNTKAKIAAKLQSINEQAKAEQKSELEQSKKLIDTLKASGVLGQL